MTANNAVDILLGESDADEFMQSYVGKWWAEIVTNQFSDVTPMYVVQWYRGLEKIGDPTEVATGDINLWVEWMQKYLNWLDQRSPFDSNTGGLSIPDWLQQAHLDGWLNKYRRTPDGKVLPPAPVGENNS